MQSILPPILNSRRPSVPLTLAPNPLINTDKTNQARANLFSEIKKTRAASSRVSEPSIPEGWLYSLPSTDLKPEKNEKAELIRLQAKLKAKELSDRFRKQALVTEVREPEPPEPQQEEKTFNLADYSFRDTCKNAMLNELEAIVNNVDGNVGNPENLLFLMPIKNREFQAADEKAIRCNIVTYSLVKPSKKPIELIPLSKGPLNNAYPECDKDLNEKYELLMLRQPHKPAFPVLQTEREPQRPSHPPNPKPQLQEAPVSNTYNEGSQFERLMSKGVMPKSVFQGRRVSLSGNLTTGKSGSSSSIASIASEKSAKSSISPSPYLNTARSPFWIDFEVLATRQSSLEIEIMALFSGQNQDTAKTLNLCRFPRTDIHKFILNFWYHVRRNCRILGSKTSLEIRDLLNPPDEERVLALLIKETICRNLNRAKFLELKALVGHAKRISLASSETPLNIYQLIRALSNLIAFYFFDLRPGQQRESQQETPRGSVLDRFNPSETRRLSDSAASPSAIELADAKIASSTTGSVEIQYHDSSLIQEEELEQVLIFDNEIVLDWKGRAFYIFVLYSDLIFSK